MHEKKKILDATNNEAKHMLTITRCSGIRKATKYFIDLLNIAPIDSETE